MRDLAPTPLGPTPHGLAPLGPTPRNTWHASATDADLRRPAAPGHPVTVPAAPQRLTLDLARTALLVIDMQNDFCSPDGWLASIGLDVSGAAGLTRSIAALLPPLRAAGVPVIWLNWGARPDRANIPPNVLHAYDLAGTGQGIGSYLPGARTPVLEEGSWGAAVVDGLIPAEGDLHIAKHRMSGFFDTPLDSVLRNLRVDTLLFTGVNADQCVMATLTDAACLGYDAVLLEDGVGTTSPDFCLQATLYNVQHCFGFVARGSDLTAALTTAAPAPGPDPS
ncbi:cysteine hydrolase family protein [Streptomyces sp. NBC_00239]|uniref:cysteine hydrolase family protein n=1 Tax=Streptomyces sp. NBC_00239 TaxID=2903640 RepID=UPI002E2A5FD6|nr:isochorismatase family cysteine hydrolase [Streptomyces sp. NBC_00239]